MTWEITHTGRVVELNVHGATDTAMTSVQKLLCEVGLGIRGEKHGGVSRLSDVREVGLKLAGVGKEIPIANMRHFSAISREELDVISAAMTPGEDPVTAAMLEANLLVEGIPAFSQLPPGSLLSFEGHNTVLAVWDENQPCPVPHENIVTALGEVQTPFARAARGRRGVVGFVYCGGKIKVGDTIKVLQRVAR